MIARHRATRRCAPAAARGPGGFSVAGNAAYGSAAIRRRNRRRAAASRRSSGRVDQ